MKRSVFGIVLALLCLGLIGLSQPVGSETIQAQTANIGPPVKEMLGQETPPSISAETRERLEFWGNYTTRPGPVTGLTAPVAGPVPGTASRLERERTMELPLAPETAKTFRNVNLPIVPAGYGSHVMESSVATEGKYLFYTGNWFAARSINGGSTWTWMNPFSGWPSWSPFCCDQVTIPDKARKCLFWLQMGSPGTNPGTGNYENIFKLHVSKDGTWASWWTYTFSPLGTNGGWTNQFWDYPHIQLGPRYLYLSWNLFNQSGAFTRTVMLRLPLDALAAAAGFSYNYYDNSGWFTFVPAQGCDHVMYFASNWPLSGTQNNRIGIWRWDEASGGLTFWEKTVAAWTLTGRGYALCGSDTGNWAARYDQRLLTGARYRIASKDVLNNNPPLGRNVIAWWWNVAQGGGFSYPYIDGAAFFEDTMTQVPGYPGRPYVYGSWCFAYPSAAVNERGDVGMIFNYSYSPDWNPRVAFSIADEYWHAPPGWDVINVKASLYRPADKKWGDYNTNRPFFPSSEIWAAASHVLRSSTTGDSTPFYFVFGRERDFESWKRWFNK